VLEAARLDQAVEPWIGGRGDGDLERRVAHRLQSAVELVLVHIPPHAARPTMRFSIGESGACGARRQTASPTAIASSP
jgi:hypothetical protein